MNGKKIRGKNTLPERLPNTYPEKDRHGKIRWRYRCKGKSAQLPGEPGSDEFLAAYLAVKGKPVVVKPPKPVKEGSIRSLVNDYLNDASFRDGKTEGTMANYRRKYEKFCGTYGESSYKDLSAEYARMILHKVTSETPSQGPRLHSLLMALMDYAYKTRRVPVNIMKDVERPKIKRGKGFAAWTDEDIVKYRGEYPVGTNERLAFELLLGTGQRGSDVHLLGWQNVKNGFITLKQVKTGNRVDIPIQAELWECLQLVQDSMTFILASTGKPYGRKSFQQWFSKSARAIGIEKSAHGLRHARGRLLAEDGKTQHQIMAVLGHSTSQMSEHYTRSADRKKLSEQALGKPIFPNLGSGHSDGDFNCIEGRKNANKNNG